MRRILKMLRKGLKTACISAALATCWNVGQTANAAYKLGDEVTVRFSGTISPTVHDLSHVFLIYGTGYSSINSQVRAIQLGDFAAGQNGVFSVQGLAEYDLSLFWLVAGLYGDLTGGQYIEGTNGVTLSAGYNPNDPQHDSWGELVWISEETLFGYLFNDDVQNIAKKQYSQHHCFSIVWDCYLECHEIRDLYDFSDPSLNGTVELTSTIVPEPMTLFLLGSGGLILLVRKRPCE